MAHLTEAGVDVGGGVIVSQKQYEEGHQNNMPGFEKPFDQLEDHPGSDHLPCNLPPNDVPFGYPASEEPIVGDSKLGEDTQPGDADLGP
jgi:hypothetical protein